MDQDTRRQNAIHEMMIDVYIHLEREFDYRASRAAGGRDNVFYFGCEKRNPERIDIVKVTIEPYAENPFSVEVLHSVMTPIYLMLVENQIREEL